MVTQLTAREYDRLLSANIVFLQLYDTSANNVVIECLLRGTPLLVNRLPAVEEYLGKDYPFYFQDMNEANDKLHNEALILETHAYLTKRAVEIDLSYRTFLHSFANSPLYRSLTL